MIESGCFKDINEEEPEEHTVLNIEEKTYHPVPKPKRGFFYRLFRRGVRVTSILLCWFFFFLMGCVKRKEIFHQGKKLSFLRFLIKIFHII